MTDTQPPEALRQAAWLKKEGASCQRHYDLGVLIERQHGELETLRAKLKTHEDLGDAGSDVQLLRMGYAAARLEIESLQSQLHAAKQINAAHGQAPAGAAEPTEQQILEAVFAPAQPAIEASRFGSPELQAMIIARCVEKDQADSVQGDAARLDWLEADESNRVFHLGKSWYTRAGYGSPHLKRASLREAIDAAIAQQKGEQ